MRNSLPLIDQLADCRSADAKVRRGSSEIKKPGSAFSTSTRTGFIGSFHKKYQNAVSMVLGAIAHVDECTAYGPGILSYGGLDRRLNHANRQIYASTFIRVEKGPKTYPLTGQSVVS
jgi:hypothetical protein